MGSENRSSHYIVRFVQSSVGVNITSVKVYSTTTDKSEALTTRYDDYSSLLLQPQLEGIQHQAHKAEAGLGC